MLEAGTVPQMLIGFPEGRVFAGRLAEELGLPLAVADLHRFPDGESLVRLPGSPRQAVIVRALDRPNDKLVELHLLAGALRERGAERLTLVAPYLAYMRQDIEFNPGEVVSQRILGRWLAGLFDRIVTVEPHLHRTHDLAEVFPGREAVALTAAPLVGQWAAGEGAAAQGWVVLGPDEEAEPLIAAVAAAAGVRGICGRKVRRGDRDVTCSLPPGTDLGGRTVLIVDDVVSSGGTLLEVARAARAAGAGRLLACGVHALFPEEMLARFQAAGIERFVSGDGVAHVTNSITLSGLVAGAVRA